MQYYYHAAYPRKYNAETRTMRPENSRAAEAKSLGSLHNKGHGSLGSRYVGPVSAQDLGKESYFGAQSLSGQNYFGGQDLGNLLSNNEKRLVAIGVIGIVGYFAFGKKIKKALK